MKPLILLGVIGMLLTGCDRLTPNGQSTGNRAVQESAEIAFDEPVANLTNAVEEAPMAWAYRANAATPIALYGTGQQEAELAIRCDRDAQQVRFSRAVPPPPPADTLLTIRAGGRETRYPASPVPNTTLSRVEARVPIDDPALGMMGQPGSHFSIRVGDGEEFEIAGGPTINRLVNACRAPIFGPLDGAMFTGTIPCADCPGIDVTLSFVGLPGTERYRLTYDYRDRGLSSWEGYVDTQEGDDGITYRLIPDGGGETVWLERLTGDTLVYRTPDNQPSDEFRRYPLMLSEERIP